MIRTLGTLTDKLTQMVRRDGLPCPPVPPQQFHLRYIAYQLLEIERALVHLKYVVLPARGRTCTEIIHSRCERIHWAICGEPRPQGSLLQASCDMLYDIIKALVIASSVDLVEHQ